MPFYVHSPDSNIFVLVLPTFNKWFQLVYRLRIVKWAQNVPLKVLIL